MVFENLEVLHSTFGKGVILSKNDKYITVKFDTCQKVFVYPDAFEKFLTLADGTVSDEINRDLDARNKQKQKISEEKREENYRAMTRGIVIPGKELNIDGEEDENKNAQEEESEL